MEFTKTDYMIIVSMTFFLVVINFTFPALGLTSPDVNQTDIPEYNSSNEAFDYLADNEAPEFPTRPSQGTLRYVDNQEVYQDNRRVWLEGSTADGGYEITLTNNGTISDPAASLFLNEYDGTSFVGANSTEMENTTEFDSLSRDGYVITFENVTYQNVGDADMTMTVDWEIAETPAGSSTVGQIPIVGDLYSSTANAIAGVIDTLGWIGAIGLYFGQIITVGTLGVLISIYQFITFLVGIGVWFTTTYASVVTAASNLAAWLGLIFAVPGILISVEFVKGVMIGISIVRGA